MKEEKKIKLKRGKRTSSEIKWSEDKNGAVREFSGVNAFWSWIDSFVTIMLIFMAANTMLMSAFGQIRIYNKQIRTIGLWFIVLTFVYEVVIEWIASEKNRTKRLRICNWISFLTIATGLYMYYRVNRIAIEDGFLKVASIYLERFNYYYRTHFYNSYGLYIAITRSLALGFIIAFSLAWVLYKRSRVKLFLSLPAILVIIALLMVGYGPCWNGIILLLLGIVFMYAGSWENGIIATRRKKDSLFREFFTKIIVCALVLGLCKFTTVIADKPSGMILSKAPEFKEFQKDMERDIKDFVSGNFWSPKVNVNNSCPEYSDKEMFRIKSDVPIMGNLYLKDYYGDTYDKGTWYCDDKNIKAACKRDGIDYEKLQEYLMYGVYKKKAGESGEDGLGNMGIDYTNVRSKASYLPYGSMPLETNKFSIKGEGILNKSRGNKSVNFKGIYKNEDYSGGQMWIYDDSMIYSSSLQEINSESNENEVFDLYGKEMAWYNDYVDSYKVSAESIPAVSEIADYIFEMVSEWDIEGSNQQRLDYAYMTSVMLADRCTYSFNLNQPGSDEDIIRYFLEESHQGYCMHFATAGVMILRELGVPARYASGYIAKEYSFRMNEEGVYEAVVKDKNAHAWVEIYLDDIGWIPFEVTPGYKNSEEDLPTDDIVNTKNAIDPAKINRPGRGDRTGSHPEEESETEETESESSETETSEKETETQETETEDTEVATDTTEESEEGVGEGGVGRNSDRSDTIFKLIVILILLGSVLCIVINFIRNKLREPYQLLAREMKKGRYNKAVKRINRLVYHKLPLKIRGKEDSIKDSEYEKALIDTFLTVYGEEWIKYMQIVKKAAYSTDDIKKSEAEFCYNILIRVREEKKEHGKKK